MLSEEANTCLSSTNHIFYPNLPYVSIFTNIYEFHEYIYEPHPVNICLPVLQLPHSLIQNQYEQLCLVLLSRDQYICIFFYSREFASNSYHTSIPLVYILPREAENNGMQPNNLLITDRRTSEMKILFSVTNLDTLFSRKCRSTCAVNWTHLFVTLMLKRILWLYFWGSSDETQGATPAIQLCKTAEFDL